MISLSKSSTSTRNILICSLLLSLAACSASTSSFLPRFNQELNNEYILLHSEANPSNTIFTAIVGFTGSANTYINATNPIVKTLNFTYLYQNIDQFEIIITDANNSR